MQFSENFKQAFVSLNTNKLRSLLTILGIIMGVFSIVAIMAIGNATKAYMEAEFNKLGANTIMIQYRSNDLSSSDLLTERDIDNLIAGIPEIANISAANSASARIRLENDSRRANVTGVSSQYTSFQVFNLVEGRFISEADNSGRRRVVVVTDAFAKKYYGKTDILGEEFKIQNNGGDIIKLMVIGVQSTEGDLFANMMDYDEFPVNIYIPLNLFQEFYNQNYYEEIDIAVKNKDEIRAVSEKVIKLLEFTHNNEDKYLTYSVQDIQQSVGSVLDVVSAVLLVIAMITLLVGGIGIVNILLVSVTERIREIGIRKALGARKKDIILQFLTESIIMTGSSGMIGILMGVIGGSIISSVIKIPPVVDVKIIILAFLGSVILGIVFGVYPAKKAADLDPIESLRYE